MPDGDAGRAEPRCSGGPVLERPSLEDLRMQAGSRSRDLGALLLGGVILFAGAWYFLRNTLGFNLDELNWEPIWPILVVALGAGIVYRALVRRASEEVQQH
jgi:hypothetical protein